METFETKIVLHDIELYEQIFTYLGIDGRKGTVRLSNEIKDFIKQTIELM